MSTRAKSMERTVAWARAAFSHYRRRTAEDGAGGQSLFPIVQGSMFAGPAPGVRGAARRARGRRVRVGGLSVGEPRPLSLEMVEATGPVLPRERPRYAMGVGMPEELPEVRGARRGHDGLRTALAKRAQRLPVHHRRAGDHQTHASYKEDQRPIDENCSLLYLPKP